MPSRVRTEAHVGRPSGDAAAYLIRRRNERGALLALGTSPHVMVVVDGKQKQGSKVSNANAAQQEEAEPGKDSGHDY